MTAPNGTPGSATGRGIALAVLSASFVALLLFVPVAMLGFTFSVLKHLILGEGMAWRSVVGMSYAFGGVLALLSLILLPVPYALFRAAGRRLGSQQAVMWVGGLLVGWHASLAAIWAWVSTRPREVLERPGYISHPPGDPDGLCYPIGFGVVAVVILVIGQTMLHDIPATTAMAIPAPMSPMRRV